MNKWQDIKLDDETMWPKGGLVELGAPHTDDRGYIQSLVNFPMKNISLISSKKGAIRSNHYHLTDWHYMYVLSGSFNYYYKPTNSDEEMQCVRVKVGEMIFTPPMEDHATVFLEDCNLLTMSRNPRDQKAYEEDVRRVTLVEREDIK